MTPRAALAFLLAFYKREPAVINSTAATLLGSGLAHFGLGVDNASTLAFVAGALNLAAGVATRALVVPQATVAQVVRDEVGDR